MSNEEQDAIIGRLVRQRADATKELSLLRVEIEEISKHLREAGETLQMQGFAHWKTKKTVEEILRNISVERILKLVADSRDAAVLRDQANAKLDELGIKS